MVLMFGYGQHGGERRKGQGMMIAKASREGKRPGVVLNVIVNVIKTFAFHVVMQG